MEKAIQIAVMVIIIAAYIFCLLRFPDDFKNGNKKNKS